MSNLGLCRQLLSGENDKYVKELLDGTRDTVITVVWGHSVVDSVVQQYNIFSIEWKSGFFDKQVLKHVYAVFFCTRMRPGIAVINFFKLSFFSFEKTSTDAATLLAPTLYIRPFSASL